MIKAAAKLLSGIVVILLLALGSLWYVGSSRLNKTRDVPARPVPIATDSMALARGQHLATAIMKCVECHGSDMGGRIAFADIGPMALLHTANVTNGKGGRLSAYDDANLARLIRHGIAVDGRPVLLMPARDYTTISDRDMAALILYLRNLPPVDRQIPASVMKPLGRVLYAAGQFPMVEADLVDYSIVPVQDHVPAPTAEYGAYLANIGGCTGCHGPGLSGGKIPGTPPDWRPATNITPEGLSGWSEDDFVRALREGVRPNGVPIDTLMPWRLAGKMDSTEMRAVWLFLQSVPPKPFGGR